MKKLMLILLSLIILVAGGAFWFLNSDKLNEIIAEQIKIQGSKFTEQVVTVAKVDMQLLHGAGTINNLVLNNPKGYSATPLFSLNEITLDINIQSLSGEPIVIDAIVIDKPEVLVEFNETGGSNIQEVLAAINKNLPQSANNNTSTDTTNNNAEQPRVKVKKFILTGVALRVDLTKLGNTTHKKVLPDIHLTNIGGETGLPANELGGVMIKKALSAIWQQAKKSQQKVLEDKVKDKVKDKIKDKATKLFDKWKKGN
ncbi:MAG: hypothetical protein JKY81_11090 [Colwellia sp.]|nr:hypothetical protein [Colwellia sp.]